MFLLNRGLGMLNRKNVLSFQTPHLNPLPFLTSKIHSAPSSAMETSKSPRPTRLSQADLVKACMFKSFSPIIDIGANLTDRSFESDRNEVILRADNMNVKAMIITGTSYYIYA